MGKVAEDLLVPATLAEVWDLYFQSETWPAWVDQFNRVETLDSGYPVAGGRLIWQSGPAGRGTVTESVLEHDPRSLHRIRYRDDSSEGELLTTFAIEGDATKVKLDLVYGLLEPSPLGPITDLLFIRSQMRGSLRRSLEALAAEARALAAGT